MSDAPHVGYVLKQYPRLSETFILNEILGLEATGVDVSVFSLRHATEGRFHPDIGSVRGPVHYMAPIDKASFLLALRSLPDLRADRLDEVLAFVDRLPEERRARLLLHAIEVAHRSVAVGITHLHAHFLTVAAHTAHIVGLLTGIPYTVTAHAKDIYRHGVDWELTGRVAAAATEVVTVCDANLSFLTHRLDGTGARILRIYNGLGPQGPPAELAHRQRGLVLGVGRLVEKKGFDTLLEAFALLALTRRDAECVIVGDGECRSALQAQASKLGISDRVTFTGPLPQQHVGRWLRRAQIVAAPCRVGTDGNQDALPTVLLEALGAGTPSVSTPVAGIPEIVESGREGLIVGENDPHALRAAMARLLEDDRLWTAMSHAGPSKLASTFDRTNTIAEFAAVVDRRMRVA